MKILTKLAAAAAVVMVLGGGAIGGIGLASAQEPGTPQAQHQGRPKFDFLGKLAANLNITIDQLKSAIKATELQIVDELLADGTITQEQADKITEKINSNEGLGLGKLLGRRHHEGQQGQQGQERFRKAARREIIQSAAGAIGIEPKELVAELKDGKSIADVAAEHNVPLDDVKAQITEDATARLAELVADGKLTQERADAMLQKLADNLDRILNASKGDGPGGA
jgi:polyhydroxyalkanoate synthesis regulator phasin